MLPLYAYGALAVRNNGAEWGTLLADAALLDYFRPAAYYTLIGAGGAHLLSLALSLWLALVFRRTHRMPPDMNPLECRTSRPATSSTSSSSTSATSPPSPRPRPTAARLRKPRTRRQPTARRRRTPPSVPFMHTRRGSEEAFAAQQPARLPAPTCRAGSTRSSRATSPQRHSAASSSALPATSARPTSYRIPYAEVPVMTQQQPPPRRVRQPPPRPPPPARPRHTAPRTPLHQQPGRPADPDRRRRSSPYARVQVRRGLVRLSTRSSAARTRGCSTARRRRPRRPGTPWPWHLPLASVPARRAHARRSSSGTTTTAQATTTTTTTTTSRTPRTTSRHRATATPTRFPGFLEPSPPRRLAFPRKAEPRGPARPTSTASTTPAPARNSAAGSSRCVVPGKRRRPRRPGPGARTSPTQRCWEEAAVEGTLPPSRTATSRGRRPRPPWLQGHGRHGRQRAAGGAAGTIYPAIAPAAATTAAVVRLARGSRSDAGMQRKGRRGGRARRCWARSGFASRTWARGNGHTGCILEGF